MPTKKKRKIEDENRQFQNEWEELYFFIQVNDNAMCLICRQTITTVFKSCNLKRHHEQKHNEIVKLSVNEQKAKLRILKMDLNSEQNVFRRSSSEANANAISDYCQKNETFFGW